MLGQVLSTDINKIFDKSISKNYYNEWLSQFDQEDIPVISTLVEHVKFFSLRKVERSLVKLYSLILKETKKDENVLFIPVGYVVKSGDIVAYQFKKQNQIHENKFIRYSDLNSDVLENVNYLVFIDDLIGTGHQCCEVWRDLKRKLDAFHHHPNLILATIASTRSGKEEIENKTTFKVISSCIIEKEEIPFHDGSNMFTDNEAKENAKKIVIKYSKNLYPKYPLGYKNNSLLVGFYYSTPNNTLPIFWSSQNQWKPLLSKADDYRDSQSLVGPESNIAQTLVFEKKISLDSDDFNIDSKISVPLLQELKSIPLLATVVPAIKNLGLNDSFITNLLALMNSLKSEVHEHKPVTSAIYITDKDALSDLTFFLRASNISINDTNLIVDLANKSHGFEDGIAIDTTGLVHGNFIYDGEKIPLNYIPNKLQSATCFTLHKDGLLILFEGNNRINFIWKGQRLISHRKSSWYYTPSNFDKLNASLAQIHGVQKEVIDRMLTIAVEMTHVGEGGLLTIGDADEVITLSRIIQNDNVQVTGGNIMDFGIRQWINILSQDGASVFDNDGILIEHMVTLIPPISADIEQEKGRGTKHQTAKVISSITKTIAIAVSVDSNFTIYSKGNKILRMNG